VEDLVIQSAFWKDKRVLVTGHTGFKGSWLSLWLEGMGARVVGYALPPSTQPNHFELAGLQQQMVSVLADIRDTERLRATFHDHQPEIVFHLAAQALVLPSFVHPTETYSTNVMGTVNLLDTIRQTKGVRAVVIVTSDKCYASRKSGPAYREGDPLGGDDPYSSSKGCTELITAGYRSSFFSPVDRNRSCAAVATARAGNVIGGGDWSPNRLIPDAIRAFAQNRPLPVRHPGAIRPWQHVLEPLAGYLILAEKLCAQGMYFAEAWNFGPPIEHTRTVEQLLDTLAGIWGDGATWTGDSASYPHEAPCLRLDASKALTRLHWQSRWSIDTALRLTVEWYRSHLSGQNMAEISRQQIGRYSRETKSLFGA
jgi:CDP-glucose 4,6-dehydratase